MPRGRPKKYVKPAGWYRSHHPEMKQGEQFLMNCSYKEFKQAEKTCPQSLRPLRMGQVAYSTDGRIVKKYRPVFGRALKRKEGNIDRARKI